MLKTISAALIAASVLAAPGPYDLIADGVHEVGLAQAGRSV